ncbi:16S rRNA (cytidine(1402)-2'-O)-methyltransferase, partial [bacterium]|nr:16S rRNA (cytidine(1402)-2'-O)-methyltransferase [bacterium]
MIQKSYNGKNALYIVPTPIGNMDDITKRSIDTLKMVDYIMAEDTRTTGVFLNKFDIKAKVIASHKFNENIAKEKVINFLNEGKNVAIVTDRGTPLISDPGYITVKEVSKLGFNVISLPGACAFVPALTSSGLNTEKFLFYGFLNSKE